MIAGGSSWARRALTTVAVAALGLLIGVRGARLFLRSRPRPHATAKATAAPPAVAPSSVSGMFHVASATGVVEARRDNRWVSVQPGDELTPADIVRTSAGARAVLRLGGGTEIELRERVEIGLDQLPGGPTVDLRRGKLLARVKGSDALAITARRTRTENQGPARFVVLADEHGRVSVAAIEGTARFSAGGRSVSLPAGTSSASEDGAPPQDPERIAEDVLLTVVWPPDEQHRGAKAEIRGQAAPSSAVVVNGAAAEVDAQGRFSTVVPLRDGKNPVDVEAEDLFGRTRRESSTIVRRAPRPPVLDPEEAELWKK